MPQTAHSLSRSDLKFSYAWRGCSRLAASTGFALIGMVPFFSSLTSLSTAFTSLFWLVCGEKTVQQRTAMLILQMSTSFYSIKWTSLDAVAMF